MAKRTAVIDIGSNSARLVVFQKTSRYGFHLLCQHKSRVRIGEGAYHRDGNLQPAPMVRAFQTLKAFSEIIKAYHVKKVLCVATSALRDAPNRTEFIDRASRQLKIDVRVIDGKEEAMFGAISATNLLPIREGISIDIGGGSTDMARIVKGRVVEAYSLNLGTVRLKELFSGQQVDIEAAEQYIRNELTHLPKHFISNHAIGIGGTARSLAKGIMERIRYPFDKLHGFEYAVEKQQEYIEAIIASTTETLGSLSIRPERYDTIREGMLILSAVLRHIGAKRVVTSGVGVREGVFLHDLLRKDNDRFPVAINPSIQSIRDRLDLLDLPVGSKHAMARKLFALYRGYFDGNGHDQKMLLHALDLSDIGKMLTIYKEHQHAFYVAMHELNFGFKHEEMLLIAMILRSKGKKYHKELYQEYRTLLPGKKKLKWLIYIYTLVLILHDNAPKAKISFSRAKGHLIIHGDFATYLVDEQITQMPKRKEIVSVSIVKD
jgi:exopolyphosphatase/guanosine-5'-triphosphate,3'-diphosphate pyrophosphatase